MTYFTAMQKVLSINEQLERQNERLRLALETIDTGIDKAMNTSRLLTCISETAKEALMQQPDIRKD